MEKIIQQNNDEITIKYMVVTLFSLLTLRKLKRVEETQKRIKRTEKTARTRKKVILTNFREFSLLC